MVFLTRRIIRGLTLIGSKNPVDELLQRFRLLLFRNGTHNGLTDDIAAAVYHISGGVSEDVRGEFSGFTVRVEVHVPVCCSLLGQYIFWLRKLPLRLRPM